MLDSFSINDRRSALEQTARDLNDGKIQTAPLRGWVNTHLHTFHSFNCEDYSPSQVVLEARKQGLDVVGSVDFDVLDAMEEMFLAGDRLEIRTVASLESRVFVADFADKELNSPGEPGVYFFMGAGFTSLPEEDSVAARQLQAMRTQARTRNEALLARLLPALVPLVIDYEADVLPLTPGGNATERHMLAALDTRSRDMFADAAQLAAYWANVLGLEAGDVTALLADTAKFRNTIRAKLMKRGGVGYAQPTSDTFPPLDDVIAMIEACDAIPCAAWLDGTTEGEADIGAWLDYFLSKGCLALNIIPDRNWNIADPEQKVIKVANLNTIVEGARQRDLIFSVGTEMNNYGLKFMDTFDAPEMAPFAADFRDGGYILYGHTVLQRSCGLGRMSQWAKDHFGTDRKAANAFYLKVGQRAFPPTKAIARLRGASAGDTPANILDRLVQ